MSEYGKRKWFWSRQDHNREINWLEKCVARAAEQVDENPQDEDAFTELCDLEAVLRYMKKLYEYIQERGSQ